MTVIRQKLVSCQKTVQTVHINLYVYPSHWPAQSAPAKIRGVVATALKKMIGKKSADKNSMVVVLGDMNTAEKDFPHPFKTIMQTEVAGTALKDVSKAYDSWKRDLRRKDYDAYKLLPEFPPGTYFWPSEMKWLLLDRIFVSPNLLDGEGVEVIKGKASARLDP